MREERHVTIAPGQVRTIICQDICGSVAALTEGGSLVGEPNRRAVVVEFSFIPVLESLLNRMLDSIAEIALSLWPDWYGGALSLPHVVSDPVSEEITLSFAVNQIACYRQEVSTTWLKVAARMCSRRRSPLPSGFSRAMNIRQLALAIQPEDLLMAIVCEEDSPAPEKLDGLARAAEWLAKETKARVAVIVSEELADRTELDPILYDPIRWDPCGAPGPDDRATEESKHTVWPIHGKPHPFSPGEQKLAKKLDLDEELRGLFQFNKLVTTVRESRFVVDLVWPEGKLVVEVDGYRHHSNRFAFNADRHRDYELMISGYMVLRLPHEEVISDADLALEKIRSLVQFKSGQSLLK